MGVDLEVTLARDFQIEQAVLGEELEHVVEEPHARVDLRPARAVEVRWKSADLGLAGHAVKLGLAGGHDGSSGEAAVGTDARCYQTVGVAYKSRIARRGHARALQSPTGKPD